MTRHVAASGFGAPWRLFTSPVRFFRSRLERQPGYLAALAPLAAYAVLSTAAVLVVARKTRLTTERALAAAELSGIEPGWVGAVIGTVASVTSVGFMFVASALALMALDALFAQSGRARRLVEFTALSYWSQLPLAVAWFGIVSWWWDPLPLRLPPGVTAAELVAVLSDYQEANARTTVLSTLQLAGAYSWCWFVALQAAALRVVSGFSVGGAWAAGILLGTLFVAIPYAAQRIW